MRNRVETAPEEAKSQANSVGAENECHHYWIIESPNGSSSRGICKFCKERREFHNSADRYILKRR